MDINGNMELENFEMVIDRISEGDNMEIDSSIITEEMVLLSIKHNMDENRELNRAVNHAIYDLLRDDLIERSIENTRDM